MPRSCLLAAMLFSRRCPAAQPTTMPGMQMVASLRRTNRHPPRRIAMRWPRWIRAWRSPGSGNADKDFVAGMIPPTRARSRWHASSLQ